MVSGVFRFHEAGNGLEASYDGFASDRIEYWEYIYEKYCRVSMLLTGEAGNTIWIQTIFSSADASFEQNITVVKGFQLYCV